jgi:CelD/BcsL family acetyltransferase involved in cellulose biosynthesis
MLQDIFSDPTYIPRKVTPWDDKAIEVKFTTISLSEDWNGIEERWIDFCDRSDVEVGFWCDPRVIKGELLVKPTKLLVAEVSYGNDLLAIVPFKFGKKDIPFKFGLFKFGSLAVDAAVLYDQPFAIRVGEDRNTLLRTAVYEIKYQKLCDIIIAQEWSLTGSSLEHLASLVRHSQKCHTHFLAETFEDFLKSKSRNTRHKLTAQIRKTRKSFEDRLSLHCYRNISDVDEFYNKALTVWKNSWHGRVGESNLPDLNFLKLMAGYGWFRSYILMDGDIPVSYALTFEYKDTIVFHVTAYDEKYMEHSPGTFMIYSYIEDLYKTDKPRVIDFGFGDSTYKDIFCNYNEMQGDIWFAVTLVGSVVTNLTRVCDEAFVKSKDLLKNTDVLNKVKSLLRNGKVK